VRDGRQERAHPRQRRRPRRGIPAALYSAFGFSARNARSLSRLIVLGRRLRHLRRALPLGLPPCPSAIRRNPASVIGPVSMPRPEENPRTHRTGQKEAKLAFQGMGATGYFIPPTVFVNVKPTPAIAARNLSVRSSPSCAPRPRRAFALVNGTRYYGGSVAPSARPRHQDCFVGKKTSTQPRTSTGAIVGRHPSAGFRCPVAAPRLRQEYLQNFLFPASRSKTSCRPGVYSTKRRSSRPPGI